MQILKSSFPYHRAGGETAASDEAGLCCLVLEMIHYLKVMFVDRLCLFSIENRCFWGFHVGQRIAFVLLLFRLTGCVAIGGVKVEHPVRKL